MPMKKTFFVSQCYLHLPVRTGAPKRLMRFWYKYELVREFEIEYDAEAPEFWVSADLTAYKGQLLCVEMDASDALDGNTSETGLDQVVLRESERPAGRDGAYDEALRPQLHFSALRGWLNDPNGLVWQNGMYHLFYQHNPYGWGWNNMHWGHAVSEDLMHWTERPIALYPDAMGTMYSGSGVIDHVNSASFGAPGEAPMVLAYTAAGDRSTWSRGKPFVQCLAYSNDGGNTFSKYAGNPVLPHIVATNRDPKLIWHALTKRWIMALFLDGDVYALFSSHDLKNWTKMCEMELPGCSECPDLFELPVDGDESRSKWVFWGGNGSYRIGDFDGNRFVPELPLRVAHHGRHSYAAQTWNNIPGQDGRVIQIAWARFDLPGMPFNRFMTIPCALSLCTTEEGVSLLTYPVRELERLAEQSIELQACTAQQVRDACAPVSAPLLDVEICFRPAQTGSLALQLRGIELVYDASCATLRCLGCDAKLLPEAGQVRVRVLLDTVFIEVFGNMGRVYMPTGVIPEQSAPLLVWAAETADARLDSFTLRTLRSIWDPERERMREALA